MKNLYLVGGTMGVGKTTACRALHEMESRSVFLDGDWCWDANPFTVTEETKSMVLDNICHILNNFIKCSQYEHIIFGWVMHEQGIIDSILSRLNLNGVHVVSVSLVCEKDELYRRLRGDVDAGIRREDVIERSMARLPLYYELNTVKIDTTGQDPEETAKVLSEMGEKNGIL